MIAIQHSLVPGIVLCLSVAAPLVQEKQEALAKFISQGNPDGDAIRNHRLTVENVRKMFAVERDLLKLMKEVPDLETRVGELERRLDPGHLTGDVAVGVKVYEGMPEIAQILQRHKISAREYLLTSRVATVADVMDATLTDEFLRREGLDPEVFITQPLKFWRSMDPALKAEAAEWKKRRGADGGGRAGFIR